MPWIRHEELCPPRLHVSGDVSSQRRWQCHQLGDSCVPQIRASSHSLGNPHRTDSRLREFPPVLSDPSHQLHGSCEIQLPSVQHPQPAPCCSRGSARRNSHWNGDNPALSRKLPLINHQDSHRLLQAGVPSLQKQGRRPGTVTNNSVAFSKVTLGNFHSQLQNQGKMGGQGSLKTRNGDTLHPHSGFCCSLADK